MYDNSICRIKDVQELIPNISNSTAQRKLSLVRDALDKKFPLFVTVKEFKDYYFL